ncbi:MAG: HK97 gp10 family phage protein [Acidobacterium ailaaui]|nr:HK97 gp10 family phage protein [Pseudacidobacterium ailaaui]
MAKEFELNIASFRQALKKAPETAFSAAKAGMHDVLDDWVVQARDIAPIDKGTLRRGIQSEGVRQEGNELVGEVSSTAIERGFNYAYYIHELDAGGKNVGGEHQYLDKSAEENIDKWERWIEDEIKSRLRGDGW